jgi:MFS family permease
MTETHRESPPSPDVKTDDAIPPLRHNRNYRRLWLSQAVALFGDEIFEYTIVLWLGLATVQGNLSWGPVATAGALAARMVPVLLFSLIGGVYSDRLDRRRVMMAMDAVRGVLVAGLAVFLMLGAGLPVALRLSVIYAVIGLAVVAAQFFNPARYGLLAVVVADRDRERMASILAGTSALASIIGPAVAAVVVVWAEVQWSLLVIAAGYALSFAAVARVRVPAVMAGRVQAAKRRPAQVWKSLTAGLRFVAGNRVLRVMLTTTIISEIGVITLATLEIFFVIRNLHAPVEVYGLLGAAFGIGSVTGAMLAAAFAPRLRATATYSYGFVLLGVLFMVYSRMTAPVGAIIVLFLLGLPVAAVDSMVGPLVMRSAPEEFMGRVSAVMQLANRLAALLSLSAAAWLATTVLSGLDASVAGVHFGPIDTILLAGGFIIALTGIWAGRALRNWRNSE